MANQTFRPRLSLPSFVFVITFLAPLFGAETPRTIPPEGVAPFDPRPLMEKVEEQIQTDKYRFAVVGDVKHASTFPPLVKFMDEELKPDFVFSTGDMVRGGGGKDGAGNWAKFAKDSGAAMRERPWWPVLGNHELAGSPAHISRHEDDPDEDDPPPELDGLGNFERFYGLEREYYTVNFRNSVFLVLPYPMPKGESKKWLKEELKKASAAGKHIFILNHCPFYTVGGKSKREIPNKETDITELFREYHVRAVLSGHDHIYYRTVRNGVPYVIAAGGGATLYQGLRLSEALCDDVYYCAIPLAKKPKDAKGQGADKTTPARATKDQGTNKAPPAKGKYIFHNGAAGWPDRVTEKQDQFVVIVDVDGPKVTMACVTAKGEKLDEMVWAR